MISSKQTVYHVQSVQQPTLAEGFSPVLHPNCTQNREGDSNTEKEYTGNELFTTLENPKIFSVMA